MTQEEIYRRAAKENRELDNMNLKITEMRPSIHGIRRIKLIPPYAYWMSRHVKPLIIK